MADNEERGKIKSYVIPNLFRNDTVVKLPPAGEGSMMVDFLELEL